MIEVKPISRDYPENAWTYTKSADGTIKITRRTRGKASALATEASSWSPGAIIELSADETMPFSGLFVQSDISLTWDGPGWATLERVYSSINNGGSFVHGGDSVSEVNEVLDVQTLEKPLTSAPFWREAYKPENEGTGTVYDGLEALKRVQLYIDAPTIQEAEKIKATFKAKAIEAKMAKKRMQGTEAFYVPAPVLTRTETTSKRPSNVGAEVAKIVERPNIDHVPVPAGFQWLGGGERVTWNGTAFTREQTWIGADYWDRDLYGELSEKA